MTQNASKIWNDINLPVNQRSANTENKSRFVTGVEDETSEPISTPEKEVKILSSEWVEGPEGFQYNKQCFLNVKVEYLKKTVRAKLRGKLFGIYNGIEEDLLQEVEGFIDDDSCIAKISINKLWFINQEHFDAWNKDKNTPCQYIIKNISHSRGENTINSEVLDLPHIDKTNPKNFKLRIPIDSLNTENNEDSFKLYSTDNKNTYSMTLTVKNDKIDNDNYIDLVFTDLIENLNYSLEVFHGQNEFSYKLFNEIPFKEIV